MSMGFACHLRVRSANSATFELKIHCALATINIVIAACMCGGTCLTLDTYTTVADTTRGGNGTGFYVSPLFTGRAPFPLLRTAPPAVLTKHLPRLAFVIRAQGVPGWTKVQNRNCRSKSQMIGEEAWREGCKVRGYLLGWQNPRGF